MTGVTDLFQSGTNSGRIKWAAVPAHIVAGHDWITILTAMFIGGAVAMLAQVAASPASTVPSLGASGAIAAVMGAFLVTYPQDQIRSLLVIFFYVRITFIPAALLIGVWFVMQLINAGQVATVQTGGVAYLAHVGGLIFGVATARLFESSLRTAEQG